MDTQQEKVVSLHTRPPRRRARRHPVRVLIYGVFFLAVIGGLVAFVTYREELSDAAFADLFSRLRFTLGQSEETEAGAFSYDDYMLSRFASFQNGLALLSGDRLVIYGPSGREKYGADCNFANPTLLVSDRTVLAYDRGGRSFLLTDNGSTLLKKDWTDALITACMNRKGAFALVSAARGYASVATVFDDRQDEMFKWYFREQLITDAALSPSAGLLALVSGGQEQDQWGDRFIGRVTLLDTGSQGEPVMTRDLPDTLPLHVGFLEEKLFYVVTEAGVSFYNEKGETLYDWSFEGRRLLTCDGGGEGILALFLGQTDACELVLLDGKGPRARLSFSGAPESLSAAGNWVGALVDGQARVYNAALEPKGEPVGTDARALLMRADGSVLLLEQSGTTVYKP